MSSPVTVIVDLVFERVVDQNAVTFLPGGRLFVNAQSRGMFSWPSAEDADAA